MTEAITQLASNGIFGLLLAIALYAYQKKDAELRAESKARVEDAQRFGSTLIELQSSVTKAAIVLGDVADDYKEERDRIRNEAARPVRR